MAFFNMTVKCVLFQATCYSEKSMKRELSKIENESKSPFSHFTLWKNKQEFSTVVLDIAIQGNKLAAILNKIRD